MRIPIIMILSPLVLCKLDCTHVFKNRVASFEYKYYPGYWMTPFSTAYIGWASTLEVKSNKKFQWILHDCTTQYRQTVCMKPGWEDHFAGAEYPGSYRFAGNGYREGVIMYLDTNLSDGSDERTYLRIFCDSCNPGGPYNTTFSNCQIENRWSSKMYSKRNGAVRFCGAAWVYGSECGDDSWYRWRIESPPTRVYWKVVLSHCNRGSTNDTVKYTVKSSITTSTSTTNTVSVDLKISAGLGAGKLLQSSGGELGASFSWSRTYLEQLARERTVETSTEVEPGMKWVVSQAVGEAGWTSIATDRTKTEKIPC